jgi:hypothetical protein
MSTPQKTTHKNSRNKKDLQQLKNEPAPSGINARCSCTVGFDAMDMVIFDTCARLEILTAPDETRVKINGKTVFFLLNDG